MHWTPPEWQLSPSCYSCYGYDLWSFSLSFSMEAPSSLFTFECFSGMILQMQRKRQIYKKLLYWTCNTQCAYSSWFYSQPIPSCAPDSHTSIVISGRDINERRRGQSPWYRPLQQYIRNAQKKLTNRVVVKRIGALISSYPWYLERWLRQHFICPTKVVLMNVVWGIVNHAIQANFQHPFHSSPNDEPRSITC